VTEGQETDGGASPDSSDHQLLLERRLRERVLTASRKSELQGEQTRREEGVDRDGLGKGNLHLKGRLRGPAKMIKLVAGEKSWSFSLFNDDPLHWSTQFRSFARCKILSRRCTPLRGN